MARTIDIDVLVVGAGPVGLAAAIELGRRGIRVLVIERNDRGGNAPRAKTTNVRTRTHMRRWGIADRLAAESPFGIDYPIDMTFVTRLSGYEIAKFQNASNTRPERSELYPEHGQWIPQYTLERVMLEHARSIPSVEVRFGTAWDTAVQDAECVTSTIHDSEGRCQIVSRYLIGADGARSVVRDLIGAKMEGRYGLSRNYNIIFRAPGLADAHRHGPAAGYWQMSPEGFSVVGPMDKDDIWFFSPTGIQEGQTFTDEEAAALIVARTGIHLPYEIISADMWVASELLADRYADRRIVLAGDACHLHPPFGGYGMNMGVGDGVDLGWKMAAVLQGWGGDALVASYEPERRPVHKFVIEEAVVNHAFVADRPPAEIEHDTPEGAALRERIGGNIQATKAREFNTIGTVLGVCYVQSPIICHEPGELPPHDAQTYTPSARPGCLAPHAWMPDGRSLYDVFGLGFSLIVAERTDPAHIQQAEADAAALGVPLTIIRPVGVDIQRLYEAKLTLIRPDQHVAWRGDLWTNPLPRVTGRGS